MAWYTDLAMRSGDGDWMICGVSLRSRDVAQQLNPQDGLYTVTSKSADGGHTSLVGSVRQVLFAPDDADAIVAQIADPCCHIVSFTVTEKGYARAPDGTLDMAQAAAGFYPLLQAGLARRRANGLPGVTLLSCDNLPDNGRVLGDLVAQWVGRADPGLAEWIAAECTAPSTMVDRIVPRTSADDLAELQDRLGMTDQGAVFTEDFSQWVIEDRFAGPRPEWERHGVQVVAEVAPYEMAKLRMLNGAHSLLAYCGLRRDHTFVHQAVGDPYLRELADRLMREEAIPTIPTASGMDLHDYADRLLARFDNPSLNHRLDQIAMDGTQKIPQRWLATAQALDDRGIEFAAIAEAFDAWLWHLIDGRFVNDPEADRLQDAARSQSPRAEILRHCFGPLHGGKSPLWAQFAPLKSRFE